MKGRRGRNRDGRATTEREVTAVSDNRLTAVWTPEDFRRAVTDLRALAHPDRGEVAPVIDIRTRKVIG